MEVTVSGLSVTFPGGTTAVQGLDLNVREGQSVALLGRNGAGKSTLLRCLLRMQEANSGVVQLAGQDLSRLSRRQLRAVRSRVGVVSQRFDLIGNVGTFHNVALGALGRGGVHRWHPATMPQRERLEAMGCLARVGMERFANQRADTLSGGQQQRVAIARMLMQRPRLILADEPVASLDPRASHEVMRLLHEIGPRSGVTTIFALHQVDLALKYAERVVALRAGRLVLDVPSDSASRSLIDSVYMDRGTPDAVSPASNSQ